MTNKFTNPAASFMALVASSLFGIFASLFCGNLWGLINKFCSGLGEFALAFKVNEAYIKEHQLPYSFSHSTKSLTDRFFSLASDFLIYPVKVLRKKTT
jgi:hypothetical protein